MKPFKTKIQLIFFLLAITNFIFSCQSTLRHNENQRRSHAKEILSQNYSRSPAARFENDPELATYMEMYLEKTAPLLSSRDVVKALLETSHTHHYDPIFLMAVIKTESQFRPGVIGSAGEIGLMQIKPDTAKWMCEKQGIKWKGKDSLKDPSYNIQIGALYFKYLKKSLKSKAAHYIAAYNSGPTSFSRMPASAQKKHPYLAKVLNNYLNIYQDLENIKLNKKLLTQKPEFKFKKKI